MKPNPDVSWQLSASLIEFPLNPTFLLLSPAGLTGSWWNVCVSQPEAHAATWTSPWWRESHSEVTSRALRVAAWRIFLGFLGGRWTLASSGAIFIAPLPRGNHSPPSLRTSPSPASWAFRQSRNCCGKRVNNAWGTSFHKVFAAE